MSSLTVPSEVASLLRLLKKRLEFRDRAGKVIGIFTPQVETADNDDAPWTPEEAERLWEKQLHLPFRPLAEFWRELKHSTAAAEEMLSQLTEATELHDSCGALLGSFNPRGSSK